MINLPSENLVLKEQYFTEFFVAQSSFESKAVCSDVTNIPSS